MVDAHYDLLTICYVCYLKNDYTKIEKITKDIKNNRGNIKCIFANLYFMSKEEMKEELHPNYYNPDVPILVMFRVAKHILNHYLPDIEFVYSIEGCDYLNINELDDLYKEGLRTIVPVWNTENKYGSGNRSDKGLTVEGINLVNKAIDLGMGIDLSHANLNTFYGLIELIKEKNIRGKKVVCFASHSNSKMLCSRERNLDDTQLKALKEVNGLVGVFCNRNFVTTDYFQTEEQIKNYYLSHIIHISQVVGIDNVMVSTDDMSFMGDIDPEYLDTVMFEYSKIYNDLYNLLQKHFSKFGAKKILYENAYNQIVFKLNKKENYKSK